MKTSRRGLLAILVLLAWGASLGWLGLRRAGISDIARLRSQASVGLSDSEAWFRVMSGSTQLGTAGVTLDTLGSAFRIREAVTIHVPRPDTVLRTIRDNEYFLTPGLAVDSIEALFVTGLHRNALTVRDEGGSWRTHLAIGFADSAAGMLAAPSAGTTALPLVPVVALPFRLALVGAVAARTTRTMAVTAGWPPVMDTVALTAGADSTFIFADSSDADAAGRFVAATRDTVEAREMVIASAAGPLLVHVDRRGTLVRLETALGVRWEREEFAIARFNFRRDLGDGAGLRAALPTVAQLAGTPLQADTTAEPVEYVVTRRDGSRIRGALLVRLATPLVTVRAGNHLVVHRESEPFQPDREVADPFIQADDSLVAQFTRSLASPTDPLAVATEVAGRMTVDTAAGGAIDAAGTVRAGRGRPEGIARLAVAVLRRSGVTANVAIGVMPVGDTLLSHAWVEAYDRRRRRWSSVDPTTGRPASTRLLRIAAGGSTHPDELLPLVADARLTRLDEATTPEDPTP